jgi:hypothetical protein
MLGPIGAPFTLEVDGSVVNQVRIKVSNRTGADQRYTIAYLDEPGARLIAPENPLRLSAGASVTTSVFVIQPPTRFENGERRVRFRISDDGKFSREFNWRLPGPNRPTPPAAESK